jgi:hypothetical protein
VRGGVIPFLQEAFPQKFFGIKTILTTEIEIKDIIQSPKAKTHQVKLEDFASLISHPLTHIWNH